MKGKQAYDERRRLEAENRLREQKRASERLDREDETEAQVRRFFDDVSRIADALEKIASN